MLFFISIYYLIFGGPLLILLGVSAALWLFISIAGDFLNKLTDKATFFKIKFYKATKIKLSTYGMYIAHMGVGIFILGISLSEGMKTYYEGVNRPSSRIKISDYSIQFSKLEKLKKENWVSETGVFLVKRIMSLR